MTLIHSGDPSTGSKMNLKHWVLFQCHTCPFLGLIRAAQASRNQPNGALWCSDGNTSLFNTGRSGQGILFNAARKAAVSDSPRLSCFCLGWVGSKTAALGTWPDSSASHWGFTVGEEFGKTSLLLF